MPIAELIHFQCVGVKSSLAILDIYSRPFAHFDWHSSLLQKSVIPKRMLLAYVTRNHHRAMVSCCELFQSRFSNLQPSSEVIANLPRIFAARCIKALPSAAGQHGQSTDFPGIQQNISEFMRIPPTPLSTLQTE